jgi:hypothetical protein
MKTTIRFLAVCIGAILTSCTTTEVAKLPFEEGARYQIKSGTGFWKLQIGGETIKRAGPMDVIILELQPPAFAKVQLIDETLPPFWINLENVRSIQEIPTN